MKKTYMEEKIKNTCAEILIKEGRVFATKGEDEKAKEKFKSALIFYLKNGNKERISWTAGASAYMAFACREIEDGISLLKIAAENGYSDIEKTDCFAKLTVKGGTVGKMRSFMNVRSIMKKNINNDKISLIRYIKTNSPIIKYPKNSAHEKLKRIVPDYNNRNDFDIILYYVKWVHENLKHDPSNKPKSGTPVGILTEKTSRGFTCREFAILTASILQMKGFYARVLTILKRDYNYGYGKSHWVIEVWIESMKKWVLFDAQNNCCWKLSKEYLNVYELRSLKKKHEEKRAKASVDGKIESSLNSWIEYFDAIWIYKNQDFSINPKKKIELYELSDTSFLCFQGTKRKHGVYKALKQELYKSPVL